MNQSNILLVDDEPEARGTIASWLRELGARVTTAEDIAGAEAALERGGFDLILSDVHLPGNHRLQWTERVLARPGIPPLLLLTGNPEVLTAVRAANLPVAGYLAKPPHFPALREQLQLLLVQQRRQSSVRQLARQAARLASGDDRLAVPLREKLEQLSAVLATETAGHSRAATADATRWRQTLAEIIAVLEKTKDSFRSKELGRLRQHLIKIFEGPEIP